MRPLRIDYSDTFAWYIWYTEDCFYYLCVLLVSRARNPRLVSRAYSANRSTLERLVHYIFYNHGTTSGERILHLGLRTHIPSLPLNTLQGLPVPTCRIRAHAFALTTCKQMTDSPSRIDWIPFGTYTNSEEAGRIVIIEPAVASN